MRRSLVALALLAASGLRRPGDHYWDVNNHVTGERRPRS